MLRNIFGLNGSEVSIFSIFPDEAASTLSNSNLPRWIWLSGGALVYPDETDPYAIPIVDYHWYIDVKNKPIPPVHTLPKDHFSSFFIYEAYVRGSCKDLDLNKYRIGKSAFKNYDANKILRRELSWNDLEPLTSEPGPATSSDVPNTISVTKSILQNGTETGSKATMAATITTETHSESENSLAKKQRSEATSPNKNMRTTKKTSLETIEEMDQTPMETSAAVENEAEIDTESEVDLDLDDGPDFIPDFQCNENDRDRNRVISSESSDSETQIPQSLLSKNTKPKTFSRRFSKTVVQTINVNASQIKEKSSASFASTSNSKSTLKSFSNPVVNQPSKVRVGSLVKRIITLNRKTGDSVNANSNSKSGSKSQSVSLPATHSRPVALPSTSRFQVLASVDSSAGDSNYSSSVAVSRPHLPLSDFNLGLKGERQHQKGGDETKKVKSPVPAPSRAPVPLRVPSYGQSRLQVLKESEMETKDRKVNHHSVWSMSSSSSDDEDQIQSWNRLRERTNTEQSSNKRSSRRTEYTVTDGQKILDYICDHDLHAFTKGNQIWEDMEQCQLLLHHTAQSMKEHFRKKVFPRKNTVYNCSKEDIAKFVQAAAIIRRGKRIPANLSRSRASSVTSSVAQTDVNRNQKYPAFRMRSVKK